MHIPERMCVGCRSMLPKHELIRIAERDGAIVIDEKQKIQARGLYVCRSAKCIAAAKKKKVLSRAFGRAVSDDVYDMIEKFGAE